jgi:Cu/Zn superoxide dismutase
MRITWGVLVLAAMLVGCGDDDSVGDQVERNADLDGLGDFEELDGDANVRWTQGTSGFLATIELENDEPGAVRPWHVHFGTCGSGGEIVGSAGDYPLLEVGDDGQALATATVSEVLDSGEDYHVNVHLSETELGTIIACGNLEEDNIPIIDDL